MRSTSLSRQSAVGALSLCLMAPLACAAPAAPGPLSGHWRFDDDGTVIEFKACGEATCGYVRQPNGNSASENALLCGSMLLGGMKPDADTGHHRGWAADPADLKRYAATLEQDGKGLKLVVRALGGLYSESYRLRPAAEAPGTCKS
jgi:uncharacterized protein (DUF2147 family)